MFHWNDQLIINYFVNIGSKPSIIFFLHKWIISQNQFSQFRQNRKFFHFFHLVHIVRPQIDVPQVFQTTVHEILPETLYLIVSDVKNF